MTAAASPTGIMQSAAPDVQHLPDASTAKQRNHHSHVAPVSHRSYIAVLTAAPSEVCPAMEGGDKPEKPPR